MSRCCERRFDFEAEIAASRSQPDAVELYVGIAGKILHLLDPLDHEAVSSLQ